MHHDPSPHPAPPQPPRAPRPRALRRAGFTLIEVLLAVSILAMIMAMAWGSYATASRSQAKVLEINDRMHEVEQAVNRLVRDISMAFITPHDPDAEGQMLEVRYRTIFKGESDRLDFTSLSNVRMFRDEKVSDQTEISFYVKQLTRRDGTSTQTLVRRQQAPIDEDPEGGGIVLPLLYGVQSVEFEYWDDAKALTAAGGDAWVRDWDSTSAEYLNRLPSRVRITIEIDSPIDPGRTMSFTTQASIRLVEALDF